MDLRQVFLVLVDISGYTHFITSHRTALLHAEGLITQLMESVIDTSKHPLRLNKLEGDAALFYAVSPETPAAAEDILRQVERFFEAFYRRQRELQVYRLCNCESCLAVSQLDLKAIVHHGTAAIKRVRRFEELAGEDVILAHRLLKNSIARKEYVLMSEAFWRVAGGQPGPELELRTETCEGLGPVKVYVRYPAHVPPAPARPPGPAGTWMRRLAQLAGLHADALLRRAGRRKAAFHHLPS